MIPWREGWLKDKMWAWLCTEDIFLQKSWKHRIRGRAKATGSPAVRHRLWWGSPRSPFPCVLSTQRNTGILIHSRPIKSERHLIGCPGNKPSLNSPSQANWPADAATPCDAGAARREAPAAIQRSLPQPNQLPACLSDGIYNQNAAS